MIAQHKREAWALRKAIADSLLEAYQTSADDGRAYAADASSPVGIG